MASGRLTISHFFPGYIFRRGWQSGALSGFNVPLGETNAQAKLHAIDDVHTFHFRANGDGCARLAHTTRSPCQVQVISGSVWDLQQNHIVHVGQIDAPSLIHFGHQHTATLFLIHVIHELLVLLQSQQWVDILLSGLRPPMVPLAGRVVEVEVHQLLSGWTQPNFCTILGDVGNATFLQQQDHRIQLHPFRDKDQDGSRTGEILHNLHHCVITWLTQKGTFVLVLHQGQAMLNALRHRHEDVPREARLGPKALHRGAVLDQLRGAAAPGVAALGVLLLH
mmetsp:Transcript_35069/g.56138  ORF Transcript_35069/g.56138 Transcript_35069/m.56138 type:complete len:279 (-) Transcript_35069:1120-1956(-)